MINKRKSNFIVYQNNVNTFKLKYFSKITEKSLINDLIFEMEKNIKIKLFDKSNLSSVLALIESSDHTNRQKIFMGIKKYDCRFSIS